MSFVKKVAVFVMSFELCFSVFSSADERECARQPLPVSFTLSGGVSVGAYQAGFLYYAGQVFQNNPELFEPKIITGASAGGINTLLSIFSLCTNESASPSESALWKSWVDLQTNEFLSPLEDGRALLSRNAFVKVVENVKKLWLEGLPKTCDIVIGIPVTRLSPDTKLVWNELGLGRQAEKFTLRVRGRGPHQAPLITNYVNPMTGGGQAVLALTSKDDDQNFQALRDLMFATSAFPLMFAPQKLKYCVSDTKSSHWLHGDSPFTCLPNEIQTAEFLDGGLFDNRPIGFADQISRAGLSREGCHAPAWREIPLTGADVPVSNPSLLFMYLDNDLHEYPISKPGEDQKYLLPYLGSFADEFISSSQSRDVLSSFEQNPSLQNQVAVAKNFFPRVSDHMLGFFGFLEKDFRKFDFYLGMYEASRYFKNKIRTSLRRDSDWVAKKLFLPEEKMKTDQEWSHIRCLSEMFELRKIECDGVDKNFKILAQISIERLSALCRAYGTSQNNANQEACSLFTNNETFHNRESDLGFTFRKLAENHFQYRDLQLLSSDSARAPAKLKTQILSSINKLASAQPWPENLAVNSIGPIVVNSIERLPSEHEGFITYGPILKAGISNLISPFNSFPTELRFAAEIQLRSIDSWFDQSGGTVQPALLAGFEYEIPKWSSVILQTRVRLLAGYQFHSTFEITGSGCLDGSQSAADCRGGMLEPGISVAILERIRFQVDGQWFVFNRIGPQVFSLVPSLGLQFYF